MVTFTQIEEAIADALRQQGVEVLHDSGVTIAIIEPDNDYVWGNDDNWVRINITRLARDVERSLS